MPGKDSPRAIDRSRKPPKHVHKDKPLINFFNSADKEILMESLGRSEFDSKFHRLLVAIQDPREAHKSLPRLARDHKVGLLELMQKYREVAVATAHFKAQERLPQVMEGIVDDALPGMDVCPRCDGSKKIERDVEVRKDGQTQTVVKRVRCPKCLGVGRVRTPGQTDARKMVLQSQGMIEAGGGNKVQVNVNQMGVPDLMQAIEVQERAFNHKAQIVEGREVGDEDR